jgi:hypothetical protein
MIFPEVMRRIQDLSGIPYYHLSPIIFGSNVAWLAATTYILASQQMPSQTGLLVFRTECYTVNTALTAAGDVYQPKAVPAGFAWWRITNLFSSLGTADGDLTDQANASHIILDTDNWLFATPGGGNYLNLIGNLSASPDVTRQVRTTCYGFFMPIKIYERLRAQFYLPNMPS